MNQSIEKTARSGMYAPSTNDQLRARSGMPLDQANDSFYITTSAGRSTGRIITSLQVRLPSSSFKLIEVHRVPILSFGGGDQPVLLQIWTLVSCNRGLFHYFENTGRNVSKPSTPNAATPKPLAPLVLLRLSTKLIVAADRISGVIVVGDGVIF